MRKWVKAAAVFGILLNCGCYKKNEDSTATDEQYGQVVSVQNGAAVISVENGSSAMTVVINDDERIAILKNDCLVHASSLNPNDQIIVTYKDGTLQVVQVISGNN